MKELTNSQKDFLQYSGMVGTGIGLVCLVQQMYIIDRSFLVAALFSLSAVGGIVAYIFVMLQKKEAGLLLIVAASLLFLRQGVIGFLFLKFGIIMISPIQVIFFIYTLVILIIFFLNGYQRILKEIAADKKTEQEYWKNNLS